MSNACRASIDCTCKSYIEVCGGPCLKHIIEAASQPNSVARTDYNASFCNNSDKTTMFLTVGGKRCKYKPGRNGVPRNQADVPAPVVFDAIRGRVSADQFSDFSLRFETQAARVRNQRKASKKRAAERKGGQYVPSAQRKLCLVSARPGYPLCVFAEFSGCSRKAPFGVYGIPCMDCLLDSCDCYYDLSRRALILSFELSSDYLVEGKRAGDIHEIVCPQIKLGGILFQGKNFSLPSEFASAFVSAVPKESLLDYNADIIENRSMAAQYKILPDLSRDEMVEFTQLLNSKRREKESKRRTQREEHREVVLSGTMTQERATAAQIKSSLDLLKEFVLDAVKNDFDLFCVSNGKALFYLMEKKLEGLSLHDLYDSYIDACGGDVTDVGFISYLQMHHPRHAEFAIDSMSMFKSEEIEYLRNKHRGPPVHKANGGGYITKQDIYSGCFKDSISCRMIAVDTHQVSLDVEKEAQAYLVGDLAKEVFHATGVSIGFLFETVGSGNRVGYHTVLCATSLTAVKSSLIRDGKLRINEDRSESFKFGLTPPLSTNGQGSEALVAQYQSKPTCDSYLRQLERKRAYQAHKKSLSDERKPPSLMPRPIAMPSAKQPTESQPPVKLPVMLMPRPIAMHSAKQPTESQPPVKLPVMPMLSETSKNGITKKTEPKKTTANMKQKTMMDFFLRPDKKPRI